MAGSDTVPYEQGSRQVLLSAGARIYDICCSPTDGGALYAFRLEVFETCWEPVYAIEIEEIDGTHVEPVSCPNGWTAVQLPDALSMPGKIVFSTDTRPIAPGANLGGFSMLSRSPETIIRWYPTNSEGVLIGRATRQELSCPTGSQTETWGSVKALYR